MLNYTERAREMTKTYLGAGFSNEKWEDAADNLVKLFYFLYQADRKYNVTGYWIIKTCTRYWTEQVFRSFMDIFIS